MPAHRKSPVSDHELTLTACRASGPGGQHVNKTASRVQLAFDIATSPSLTDDQKNRLLSRLHNRLAHGTVLRLTASRSRSQAQNRQEVIDRFHRLIRAALHIHPPRRPTTPTPQVLQQRQIDRRRHADKKERRRTPLPDDG